MVPVEIVLWSVRIFAGRVDRDPIVGHPEPFCAVDLAERLVYSWVGAVVPLCLAVVHLHHDSSLLAVPSLWIVRILATELPDVLCCSCGLLAGDDLP